MVALNVDYENFSTVPEAVENAELAGETPGALVVNVHANYVIEGADRHTDMAFPPPAADAGAIRSRREFWIDAPGRFRTVSGEA